MSGDCCDNWGKRVKIYPKPHSGDADNYENVSSVCNGKQWSVGLSNNTANHFNMACRSSPPGMLVEKTTARWAGCCLVYLLRFC